MSGRLARVADNDEAISDSERLRLGRLVFDGASTAELAERSGLPVAAVEAAWLFCRHRLSQHFADAAGQEFRLLDDEELRSQAIECLRLLLDWRASVIERQRFGDLLSRDIEAP